MNYHYCLRSPALRPSWASVARQRIDSPLRANCRCAGSAVVSTSSPLSFDSWSHRERIGLSGAPIIGSWPDFAANTRSGQPPRRSREAFRSTTEPLSKCRRSPAAGVAAAGLGHREKPAGEQMTTNAETIQTHPTRRADYPTQCEERCGHLHVSGRHGARPDGSRERQRFTFPTLAEARREYRRITTEVAAGTFVKRDRTTVADTCLYGSIVDAMCGPTPLRGTDIRSSRLSTTSVLWHCNNYGLPTSTTW
jgi:hypothetical protein